MSTDWNPANLWQTRRSCDTLELMKEHCPRCDAGCGGRRQMLSDRLPEHLPPIWVDEDMARRVLINLMENASKFTPVRRMFLKSARVEEDDGSTCGSRITARAFPWRNRIASSTSSHGCAATARPGGSGHRPGVLPPGRAWARRAHLGGERARQWRDIPFHIPGRDRRTGGWQSRIIGDCTLNRSNSFQWMRLQRMFISKNDIWA